MEFACQVKGWVWIWFCLLQEYKSGLVYPSWVQIEFRTVQLSTNMVQITSIEYKYSSVHSVGSWVGGRFRNLSVELGWIKIYGDLSVKLEADLKMWEFVSQVGSEFEDVEIGFVCQVCGWFENMGTCHSGWVYLKLWVEYKYSSVHFSCQLSWL